MASGRRQPPRGGISIPRPERLTLVMLIAFTVTYVLQLLALRNSVPVIGWLALHPTDVVRGQLWQPVTSWFLHDPGGPGHLLMNLLMLWLFGTQLEGMMGSRRYLSTCLWSGLAGGLATMIIGGLLYLMLPGQPDLAAIWTGPTLGASGIVMGVMMAWTALQWDQELHMFLLGRIKARHFALLILGIELLSALSYDGASWTSHLGGAGMGYLIGRGFFPPPNLRRWASKRKHKATQARLRGLQVIQGGRQDDDDTAGPPLWGPPRGKGPTVH